MYERATQAAAALISNEAPVGNLRVFNLGSFGLQAKELKSSLSFFVVAAYETVGVINAKITKKITAK